MNVPGADRNVQDAFNQLERRIRELEKQMKTDTGAATRDDVDKVKADLKRLTDEPAYREHKVPNHFLAPIGIAPGSAAVPSLAFTQDPDTGLMSPAANELGFVTNAVVRWEIDSNGMLRPVLNNTYDIGTTTYKVKDIHLAGDAYIGGDINLTGGAIGLYESHGASLTDPNGLASGTYYSNFWFAPYAGTITKMYAYKLGGTSIAVNILNGTQSGYIRSSNYTITTDNQIVDCGTLQNTTFTAQTTGSTGRWLAKFSGVSGTVTVACVLMVVYRTS